MQTIERRTNDTSLKIGEIGIAKITNDQVFRVSISMPYMQEKEIHENEEERGVSMSEKTAVEGFGSVINRITDEVMTDGTLEEIIRTKVIDGFSRAIEASFSYGELSNAINSRVKEVLVPAVERYDMGAYVVKLDEILSQIVAQTTLVDNERLLRNFKGLMIEPTEKVITLEKLFGRYCKYVAEKVDTSNLEIDYDDGVSYQYVSASAWIAKDDDKPGYFKRSSDYATLMLGTEEDPELSFAVLLSRWDWEREDGYRMDYDVNPTFSGIRYMNNFEVYLSTLSRAGVRLTWDKDSLGEDVLPEAEPEASFS